MSMVGPIDKPCDLLLGRKTYDIFASYWPHVPADNLIGPAFTKANKYVLTRGSARLDCANSHKMRNLDDLGKVKAGEGPDIVTAAHLPDRSWKRQKALRQHLAPREHDAG